MPLSDTLQLETQQAFRELDALQGRLDRISDVRLDVRLDTSTLNADIDRTRTLADQTADAFGRVEDQVVLTTDQYRRAVSAMDQGLDASQAIAVATGRVADEAASAEDAVRRVASAMNLSEDEATELANAMGRSTREATELDNDLRQVARAMGLSEQEAAQFTKEMRQASTQASTLDSRTNDIARGWGRVRGLIVGAVAAFGVRGLVRQFDQAIDASLELGESINAVNVIFDEGADAVLNFAETAAESAGLAAGQAQQLVVPIGASLRNFGFEAEAAGDAAVVLTQRAADLASVFNSEVTEALTAIQAALRGETDPIERFGASISAARVEAFALSQGLAATKAEITDAVKVQARYGLILQDTAAAAGDFANTSDEAANQQRILAAQVQEARAGLGDALLPAFQGILSIAPRFLIDVRAMGEVIRGVGDEAEAASSGIETFGDFAGVASRSFGLLGQTITTALGIASTPVEAVIESFRQLDLRGGIDQFTEIGDSVEALIDAFENRRTIEAFISDLKAGVDPALAFANAAAEVARDTELTAEGLDSLARISGASPERLANATIAMLEQGEAAGFEAAELEVLQRALAGYRREIGQTAGPGSPAQTFASDLAEAQIAAEEFELAEKERQLQDFNTALDGVAGVAEDTGISFLTAANNIGFFDSELVPLVREIGAAELAAANFDVALQGLQTATRLDLGDAVDEFDLLISKTNEAGDEVPATVNEMLTDLQQQADRFARFEAATTILEALGFDSLAADIRAEGLDALPAAEAFLDDLPGAEEAERVLEEGGNPGTEYIALIEQAIESGNLTPAALERMQDLTSDQVRQAVTNAATELGGLFGQELLAAIDLRTDIRIPVNLIPEIQGSTGGVDPTGAGVDTGLRGPNTGGGVTLNQTNNFNGTQVTGTDVARITQSTASVIRSRAE